MQRKLTEGKILTNILYFSVPYLISYFLQTLYGLMDLFITGQYNGAAVITAVSVGSQIMHMITVIIVGIAMGSTVLIGRGVGAGKKDVVSRAIGNTITTQLITSVVLAVLLIILIRPILSVTSVPAESAAQTRIYLLICFAGIPLITAYNIISSIFRGLGDSRTPMYFIAIACVVNIVLDYLFIGPMHMEAAGAALGTIAAQAVSVVTAFFVIRKKHLIELSREDLRPDREIIRRMLSVGIPIAAQDGLIQVSFMIITVIANRRGVDVAAAVGIVEKIITFLFLVPSTMLSTVSAMASQNLGAGLEERAREALRTCAVIGLSVGILFGVIAQFTSVQILRMFTGEKVVIALGAQYLVTYVWDVALASIHFSFSGYFSACGYAYLPFIYNVIPIVCIRIPIAYYASVHYPDTLYQMGVASPAGSAVSAVICTCMYLWIRGKEKKEKRQERC